MNPFLHRLRPRASSVIWLAILVVGWVFVSSAHAESTGRMETDEGGYLIVAEGWVVEEVPVRGKLPAIAVGRSDGVHYLYDPNNFHLAGIWTGRFGKRGEDGALILDKEARRPFDIFPRPFQWEDWKKKSIQYEWRGYEKEADGVVFRYRLTHPEQSDLFWDVEERLEIESSQVQRIHFKLEPSRSDPDFYFFYRMQQAEQYRKVASNGQSTQRGRMKILNPDQRDYRLELTRRPTGGVMPRSYSVSTIPVPKLTDGRMFEPTDWAFAPDGKVYAPTRVAGVWCYENGKWTQFAEGLYEALGIALAPNGKDLYVMQKPELTLLRDTDGDGRADLYQTIEDRFRHTGAYHAFAYGPRRTRAGDLFFSLNLNAGGGFKAKPDGFKGQMSTSLGYLGWVMKRTAAGDLIPFANGLRSPAGIGINAKDELFITDNQGDWVPSSCLHHVEAGDFLGHPVSLYDEPRFGLTPPPEKLDYRLVDANHVDSVPALDRADFEKRRKLPAVWLTHIEISNSPGHPSFCETDAFGPFRGQCFIADMKQSSIMRVALEKVGGAYQGAVFPFISGLGGASYACQFSPDGKMWVGSVGRGWGKDVELVEVISWDGKAVPFEMHHIALARSGFDIHFTLPVAESNLPDADAIDLKAFQYHYWDKYGSEEKDLHQVAIRSADWSEDRRVLSLSFDLETPYCYRLELPANLRAADGAELANHIAFYTLNHLLPPE